MTGKLGLATAIFSPIPSHPKFPAGRRSVIVWFERPTGDDAGWWTRVVRPRYSHVVLQTGDTVWDLPIDGSLESWTWRAYEAECEKHGTDIDPVFIDVSDHDPITLLSALVHARMLRSQKVRTALRWLRLWPRPAVNCMTSVRTLLAGIGVKVRGETPDELAQELRAAAGVHRVGDCTCTIVP